MTRPEEVERADSPVLSVALRNPTRLSDIEEWVAACYRLGMTPDLTTVETTITTLTASVLLDQIDDLTEGERASHE